MKNFTTALLSTLILLLAYGNNIFSAQWGKKKKIITINDLPATIIDNKIGPYLTLYDVHELTKTCHAFKNRKDLCRHTIFLSKKNNQKIMQILFTIDTKQKTVVAKYPNIQRIVITHCLLSNQTIELILSCYKHLKHFMLNACSNFTHVALHNKKHLQSIKIVKCKTVQKISIKECDHLKYLCISQCHDLINVICNHAGKDFESVRLSLGQGKQAQYKKISFTCHNITHRLYINVNCPFDNFDIDITGTVILCNFTFIPKVMDLIENTESDYVKNKQSILNYFKTISINAITKYIIAVDPPLDHYPSGYNELLLEASLSLCKQKENIANVTINSISYPGYPGFCGTIEPLLTPSNIARVLKQLVITSNNSQNKV